MGSSSSLTSKSTRRCVLLLMKIAMMSMILVARRVKCDDQMMGPETGLLCISECATCPSICSPPPPPLLTSFPPPTSHHSPPPQSYYHFPPSTPPPPKQSSHSPPPQASSWYPLWGIPPPPNNTPKSQAPPMQGPNNYPYPYYYFYASDASSVSVHASIFFSLLMLFHVLYLI